jgi:cell wall assembly regulator SMI1
MKIAIEIQITDSSFLINQVTFRFPVLIKDLSAVLGEARKTVTKYNTIYTWDEAGFLIYSKDDMFVGSLHIDLNLNKYAFSPRVAFTGSCRLNGIDASEYFIQNKNQAQKSYAGGSGDTFIFNQVKVWFDYDNGVVSAIEISQPEKTKEKQKPLSVDAEFKYVETLWADWIAEVGKYVPNNNRYYNLADGISVEQLSYSIQGGLNSIPEELVNFYKVHNVYYNSVAAAFSFSFEKFEYYLLPFQDITRHWKQIQDLQFENGSEKPIFDDGSFKLKSNGYANQRWIPIAEDWQGNYLLFDTDPGTKGIFGQILELQNESWSRVVIADSLETLVRNEIKTIKSNPQTRFEFILKK